MTNVNENTLNQNTESEEANRNQDTEEVKEKLESIRNTESEEEYNFFEFKKLYEVTALFVKLIFNNYFSNLKENEQIKECDAEEFFKSENTEEFQNQKIRYQNILKVNLFETLDDGPLDFALNSFSIYGWKLIGLFK